MRATGIRYNPAQDGSMGLKPTERILDELCQAILAATGKAGYITDAHRLTGSAIKIGLHMSSFRVDTAKLGHNARVGRFVKSPKGYKRTDVPTWDQRVEFNDIVNDVFDRYGLVALIKSGSFTVRDKREGRKDEGDWQYQKPMHYGFDYCPDEIMPEADARDACDSDRLEAEHKAAQAPIKREQARAARQRRKLFESCRHVTLAGFYRCEGRIDQNDKKMTHKQFAKRISTLSSWERRRVVKATMEETCKLKLIGAA